MGCSPDAVAIFEIVGRAAESAARRACVWTDEFGQCVESKEPSPPAVVARPLCRTSTECRESRMENVTSADGTSIAYSRSGRGPALVLVVGAFCDRETTSALSPLLGSSFTVFEYDRRGRGASTDTPPYAVGREVEDLRAVIEAAGGSAFAYGHSSGAILVLEAITSGAPISEAAVYEPPYTVDRNGDGASDRPAGADRGTGARHGRRRQVPLGGPGRTGPRRGGAEWSSPHAARRSVARRGRRGGRRCPDRLLPA